MDVVTSSVMHHALSMFFQPASQVRRHADVEGASIVAGKDIDDRVALHVGPISDCVLFVTTINDCICATQFE
jgi:hypothetical protein